MDVTEEETSLETHGASPRGPPRCYKQATTKSSQDNTYRHYCGSMDVTCQFCGSVHFKAEMTFDKKSTSCCDKGKITFKKHDYPKELQELLTDSKSIHYNNFKSNIRHYNDSFAFASADADIDEISIGGLCWIRIHGQIRHSTLHLHPPGGTERRYCQLYAVDSEQAIKARMKKIDGECNVEVMRIIDKVIGTRNVYAKSFKALAEIEKRENEAAEREIRPRVKLKMIFLRDRTNHYQDKHDMVIINDLAMIYKNGPKDLPEYDIKIYPKTKDNKSILINLLSPNIDPMTYPLLFPYGEPGWHPNMQSEELFENRTKCNITTLQHKVYLLAIRRNVFNPIHHTGTLSQQYIVDSFLQAETDTLSYILYKQNKLDAEHTRSLRDYLDDEIIDTNFPNVRMSLPSYCHGSPQNLIERYRDTMTIVQHFGNPDISLKFMCNPYWDEITENLYADQNAADRPDLLARVFKIKLAELIKDISVGDIFGKVAAYVYTIEFEKYVLPYCDMLIFLDREHKIKTDEHIDRLVRAEIPDENLEPILFELVMRHMIHFPCKGNPSAACMENGTCENNFPREFQNETDMSVLNIYPKYRRRRQLPITIKDTSVDNRYVIPYNKYLLTKYNAHINIEICSTIKSFAYIYKYVYKIDDIPLIDTEIKRRRKSDDFLSKRYMSGPEAVWRLSENKMHDISHSVIKLAVHLPLKQAEPRPKTNTMLTGWFILNRNDTEANNFLYNEIPNHFVWNKHSKEWKIRDRKSSTIVSRMYTVNPREGERFFLYLLLLHVRGARSFEDIRTLNGVTYDTFKEAAVARNLLHDDGEWFNCLEEAAMAYMPSQLRHFFACICVFCNPQKPLELWQQFNIHMIEDLVNIHNDKQVMSKALLDIEQCLIPHRLTCQLLDLPLPNSFVSCVDLKLSKDNFLEIEQKIGYLNCFQKSAFEQIIHTAYSEKVDANCFFIDGAAGSGKTYLCDTLIRYIRIRKGIVLPFALSDTAVSMFKGGRTVHTGFMLPVPTTNDSVSSMPIKSNEANDIRLARLIVIEEASAMTKDDLHCIDTLMKKLMQNEDDPFGGKVIVLTGDFRQIVPVVPNVKSCIKSSPLWANFIQIKLYQNMCIVPGHVDYDGWLRNIGNGNINLALPDLGKNYVKIPQKMIVSDNDIVNVIYGDHIDFNDINLLARKVILSVTDEAVAKLNRRIFELIPTESQDYYSADSVDDDSGDKYTIEFLNAQCPSDMPPHKLTLKQGCVVTLLRNLNPEKGLYNGTRLIIRCLYDNFIDAEVLSGTNRKDRIFIPRINLCSSDSSIPCGLKRRQFPIVLAFATCIDKSRGQTFDSVGIYLSEPVISHGQLYVALSRCTKVNNIKIKMKESTLQGKLLGTKDYFTLNIVQSDFFQ